jgi:DNA-binding response OmpR family regulator
MRVRKLLIVEDDPDLAKACQLVLAHPEVEITIASNGMEAIRKAQRIRPDLVLLDVELPIVDGFEVYRALRSTRELRSTRVIFLSGYADPRALAVAKDLGAFECFSKPFRPACLRASVLSALAIETAADAPATAAYGAVLHGPSPAEHDEHEADDARIMLIDADVRAREDVEDALSEAFGEGAKLIWHRSGLGALEDLTRTPVDVVILDIRLPDIHGLNLLKLMKHEPRLRDIPVIVLAASTNPGTLAGILGAGAETYIFKPIDRDLLASSIRHSFFERIGAPDPGRAAPSSGPRVA